MRGQGSAGAAVNDGGRVGSAGFGVRPGAGFRAGFDSAAWRAALTAALARESAHRTPFLWLPVAFGLGILGYFAAADEPRLWAGPALALVLFGFARRAEGAARALLIAALAAVLGFTAAAIRTASVAAPMLERERIAEIRGFVETVEPGAGRQRLTMRPAAIEGLEAARLPHRLRIGAPGSAGAAAGDFVVLRARLAPPAEPALPGGYDVRREFFFRGVGGVGFAIGPVRQEAPPMAAPWDLRLIAAIDRARNALTARIARAIGGEAGALAAALITGKRGLIGSETNENLRAAGLYHIVSISGLHMVLAAGLVFWSVRAGLALVPGIALRHPIKKYAALAAMAGASGYCLFSGAEVATERALIMTLVMLGAILADRPALAMRNVAIAALIVLAREPESLTGPSFQMSFAAVASLIAANQIWRDWQAGRPGSARAAPAGLLAGFARRLGLGLLGIAATTLVATFATAPFAAFHFSRINPYGLIGNMLALPLVSLVVMPAAMAGTLLVPFGLDRFVWQVMGIGIEGVLAVAEFVAAFEQASLAWPGMRGGMFFWLVVGLVLFVALRSRLRLAALACLALAGVSAAPPALPDLVVDASGRLALLRGADGRYRLIAAGAPNRFILQQWLPALGDNRAPDDPTLRQGVACDSAGCVGRLADGRRLALVTRPDALREDCRRADFAITPLAAPPDCAGGRVLDAAHFRRHGATRAWFAPDGGWRLERARDPAIDRPWRPRPAPNQ